MVVVRWACVLAVASAALSGCYLSHTPTAIPVRHAWTGTGRIFASTVSSDPPLSAGFDGPQLWLSPRFISSQRPGRTEGTSSIGLFTEDYDISSMAQSFAEGVHWDLLVHGNVRGRTDNLTIFTSDSNNWDMFVPIEAVADTAIIDGEDSYIVTRICDMAGVTATGVVSGDDRHVFLSVIACANGGSNCAGGLVEISWTNRWLVRNTSSSQQGTVRGSTGQLFSPECMPITTTGYDRLRQQWIAVADPSEDEILIYGLGQLNRRPISVGRFRKPNQVIKDLVFVRADESRAYLTALWKADGAATLEHYIVGNGSIAAGPLLTEPVPTATQFIEGVPYRFASTLRNLYSFSPSEVYEHPYDLADR